MPDVDPPPLVAPPRRAITIRRRTFGFVVSPGTFRIDIDLGETPRIKLRNRAGLDARITFPDGAVLDEQDKPINAPFTIAPGADKKLTVDTSENRPEFFEYTVEMITAGIEAQGNSRPGVEIVR